jgi:hypothetical protein
MDSLIRVPTIPNRTQIPQATIRSLAEQIYVLFHPQKIILFGSYASGTPRPESDVDLLVVMDTQLSELEQAAAICRSIPYRFAWIWWLPRLSAWPNGWSGATRF